MRLLRPDFVGTRNDTGARTRNDTGARTRNDKGYDPGVLLTLAFQNHPLNNLPVKELQFGLIF